MIIDNANIVEFQASDYNQSWSVKFFKRGQWRLVAVVFLITTLNIFGRSTVANKTITIIELLFGFLIIYAVTCYFAYLNSNNGLINKIIFNRNKNLIEVLINDGNKRMCLKKEDIYELTSDLEYYNFFLSSGESLTWRKNSDEQLSFERTLDNFGISVVSKPIVLNQERDLLSFKISPRAQFFLYKLPLLAQFIAIILFCFWIISGIVYKKTLFEIANISFFTSGLITAAYALVALKIRKARFGSALSIDILRKQFVVYIYDIQKEISFNVSDIEEVGSSPEMFRFYLKDKTWVSWARDDLSHKFIGEFIKSCGIEITTKKLW